MFKHYFDFHFNSYLVHSDCLLPCKYGTVQLQTLNLSYVFLEADNSSCVASYFEGLSWNVAFHKHANYKKLIPTAKVIKHFRYIPQNYMKSVAVRENSLFRLSITLRNDYFCEHLNISYL